MKKFGGVASCVSREMKKKVTSHVTTKFEVMVDIIGFYITTKFRVKRLTLKKVMGYSQNYYLSCPNYIK